MRQRSEQEHRFTSTGIKFWRHRNQMIAYQLGDPNTIISAHISPEGRCNLNCEYCSVSKRDKFERIDISVIHRYVLDLMSRGLRAVILTGGGEPTLYSQFDELVEWVFNHGLAVALITNGTNQNINCWDKFSWVRVSINRFNGWKDRIQLPVEKLADDCIVGCSFVYDKNYTVDDLQEVGNKATQLNAQYIRLLPNCLLEQEELLEWHDKLDELMFDLNDARFFHQFKVHRAPEESICHQSYFRPYLSEVDGGTVYPCDSLVLNDNAACFGSRFQLCKAEDVLKFLDRQIEPLTSPRVDCTGCVFADTVEMLGAWHRHLIDRFDEFQEPLTHEEFV